MYISNDVSWTLDSGLSDLINENETGCNCQVNDKQPAVNALPHTGTLCFLSKYMKDIRKGKGVNNKPFQH